MPAGSVTGLTALYTLLIISHPLLHPSLLIVVWSNVEPVTLCPLVAAVTHQVGMQYVFPPITLLRQLTYTMLILVTLMYLDLSGLCDGLRDVLHAHLVCDPGLYLLSV